MTISACCGCRACVRACACVEKKKKKKHVEACRGMADAFLSVESRRMAP
jgi:hypothetical protein